MSFNLIANGTPMNAPPVMENFNKLTTKSMITTLNQVLNGTLDIDEGVLYSVITQQTDTTYVNKTETNCYYDNNGLVAFCKVLDMFDDGVVDTNVWSTTASGMASVTESNDTLYVRITDQGLNVSGTATAISDEVNGVNINGQDAEILVNWRRYFTWSDDNQESNAATQALQLSDGTTHINLRASSQNANGSEGNINVTESLRIKYDHSAQTVRVSINGGAYGSAIDVSSITNKYIRFYATQSGSGDSTVSGINVYGVGYVLDGATAESVSFVSATQTIASSDSFFGYSRFKDGINPASVEINASVDAGVSFSADNSNREWDVLATAGTDFQMKITGELPTTVVGDNDASSIPELEVWSAFYE